MPMTNSKSKGGSINPVVTYLVWAIAGLVVWTVGTNYSLPSLSEIPTAWATLVKDEGLLHELWVSVTLNAEAVTLSAALSTCLAYLTVDKFWNVPGYALSTLRFSGLTGFVVIFTRFFGGGHALKVALLVFSMSTFFVTSMIDIVASTTRDELDHARTLKMSRWRSILEVVVLGKADQAFDALRQNAAQGWMMLTMIEGLVRFEGGVGVIMLNESKYRNLAAVFAAIITITLVGIIQDQTIAWLKNICCPHAKLALENK